MHITHKACPLSWHLALAPPTTRSIRTAQLEESISATLSALLEKKWTIIDYHDHVDGGCTGIYLRKHDNMYIFIYKHTHSICSSLVSCYLCIFTCIYSLIYQYISINIHVSYHTDTLLLLFDDCIIWPPTLESQMIVQAIMDVGIENGQTERLAL